jgi:hypothetical protein
MDERVTAYGHCHCGCGEQTKIASQNHARHGWVRGEPLRFVAGHSGRKSPVEYLEEDRGHGSPCWIWQRAKSPAGYGMVNIGNRTWRGAHRVMFERFKGSIPIGLQLDHLCVQPLCVNPDHLEAVSPAENVRRGRHTKLRASQVCGIRASSESTGALAHMYDVDYDTVWNIRSGRTWAS